MGRRRTLDREHRWVTVRMPLKLLGGIYRLIARKSKLQGRKVSRSEIVREAIEEFMKQDKEHQDETRKARKAQT